MHFVEIAIAGRLLEEFGVGAGVGDAALAHHDDHVGGEDCRQAVGDGDDGFAGGKFFQGGLDHALALRIEGGGGFVEEEDWGVLQQGAGDGEALLLSAGELAALVADDGLVALRLGEDEIMRVGLPGGFFDFFLRSLGTAEADIVQDGVVEKEGVLGDNADLLAQGVEGDAAQVEPVEKNGPILRVVKPEDEGEHGALSGAAGSDESDTLAGCDAQGDVLQSGDFGPVGKTDAVESDFAAAGGDRGGVRRVFDIARFAHQFENIRRGGEAALEHEVNAAEGFDRLVKQEDAGHEGEEFGGGETGGEDVEEGKSDAEGGNDLDKRGGDFRVFEHAHRIAELVHDRVVEELHHELFTAERFDHPDAGEGFLQDDVHFAGQLLLGASRFAHFAAIHGHRHNADREEDKGHEAEFPVDPHHGRDAGNQGNGLFKEVDADLREGALGHTGIAEDARHEPAGLGFVEEALALVDDAGEQFAADIVEHAEADPRHFVGVEVGEEAAQNHDERHEQADPQDCLEPGARAGCGSFGNLLLVRASGENAIADQLDDQGNRTVD